MRYRTKRALIRIISYLFYTFLILLGYVYAAQKKYLPAFFEYYTGKAVREVTASYYQKYFEGKESQEKVTPGFMDFFDSIIREPSYIYISDVLDSLTSDSQKITGKTRDNALRASTFPALLEWMKNPYGKFVSVYQYEAQSFLEDSLNYNNYIILDSKGKTFASSGQIQEDYSTLKKSEDLEYYNGMLVIPVVSGNKVIGRIITTIENRIAGDLNFSNTGIAISWFWIDSQKNIKSSSVSEKSLNKWIQDKQYVGPFSGIKDNHRFVQRPFGSGRIIVSYPAESVIYYVMKMALFIILISFIAGILIYWDKINPIYSIKEKWKRSNGDRALELLEKSNKVNEEYATLSIRYQNSIQAMKLQEIDRLKMISEHLTYLHKSVYKPGEEEILEVRSID